MQILTNSESQVSHHILFIHVHGTCSKMHKMFTLWHKRGRETETETETEKERERERDGGRGRGREGGRGGYANVYQFRMTSESPCLVYTRYL